MMMKSICDLNNIQVYIDAVIAEAAQGDPELEKDLFEWVDITSEKLLKQIDKDVLKKITCELDEVIPLTLRAGYHMCKTGLSREVNNKLRNSGLQHIGYDKATKLFADFYLFYISEIKDIKWEEVLSFLNKTKKNNVALKSYNDFSHIINEDQRKLMMAEHLARGDFEDRINFLGKKYYSSKTNTKAIEFREKEQKKLIDTIENIIEPLPALSFKEIAQRQGDAINVSSNASLLYTSKQSVSISDAQKRNNHNSLSLIPWCFTEAPVYVKAKKDIEYWAIGTVLGFQFLTKLYLNPEECLKTLNYLPNSIEYHKLLNFHSILKTVLDWKIPANITSINKNSLLEYPLTAFIRPDFSIEKTPDNKFNLVATEIENAPGGLGKQEIIFAGYPQVTSNLLEMIYKYMQEVKLPKSISSKFNRNKITILTSEAWMVNKTEYAVFSNLFKDKYDVNVDVYTIEELIRENKQEVVNNCFIYHLAYPWVFIKEVDKYFVNIMLKPKQVASYLGCSLKDILHERFLKDSKIIDDEINPTLDKINYKFRKIVAKSANIRPEDMCSELIESIYNDDVLRKKSRNGKYLNLNIQAIGKIIATKQNDSIKRIYKQQGQNVIIINDPALGQLIFSKMGMACLHLPQFVELFADYLEVKGYKHKKIEKIIEKAINMNAKTIPLIGKSFLLDKEKSKPELIELINYTTQIIDHAKSAKGKQEWILKLCIDPYFSFFDWGARGIWVGKETPKKEWEEILLKAMQSDIPFVLQKLVNHIKFKDYRKEKKAENIYIRKDNSKYGKIGIFQNNPEKTDFGKLRLTETSIRLNIFIFAMDNINNSFQVLVPNGYATFTPCRGDDKMEKVHFTSHSSASPAIFF